MYCLQRQAVVIIIFLYDDIPGRCSLKAGACDWPGGAHVIAPGRTHPGASGYRHLPARGRARLRPALLVAAVLLLFLHAHHRPPRCSRSSPALPSGAPPPCAPLPPRPRDSRRLPRRSPCSRRSSRFTDGCVPARGPYACAVCSQCVLADAEPRQAGREADAAVVHHRPQPVRAHGECPLYILLVSLAASPLGHLHPLCALAACSAGGAVRTGGLAACVAWLRPARPV